MTSLWIGIHEERASVKCPSTQHVKSLSKLSKVSLNEDVKKDCSKVEISTNRFNKSDKENHPECSENNNENNKDKSKENIEHVATDIETVSESRNNSVDSQTKQTNTDSTKSEEIDKSEIDKSEIDKSEDVSCTSFNKTVGSTEENKDTLVREKQTFEAIEDDVKVKDEVSNVVEPMDSTLPDTKVDKTEQKNTVTASNENSSSVSEQCKDSHGISDDDDDVIIIDSDVVTIDLDAFENKDFDNAEKAEQMEEKDFTVTENCMESDKESDIDMECENIDDENERQGIDLVETSDVEETQGQGSFLKITNVTGSLSLADKNGELSKEIADDVVIELNMDNIDDSNDSSKSAELEGSTKITRSRSRKSPRRKQPKSKKNDTGCQESESSEKTAGSERVGSSGRQDLQPVMMCTNIHNSPVLSATEPPEKRPRRSNHRETGFNPAWIRDFPWVEEFQNGMRCKLCLRHQRRPVRVPVGKAVWVDVPCMTIARDSLNKHARSMCHKEAVGFEATCREKQQQIDASVQQEISVNKQAEMETLRNLILLAKEEIPHTTKKTPETDSGRASEESYGNVLLSGDSCTVTQPQVADSQPLMQRQSVYDQQQQQQQLQMERHLQQQSYMYEANQESYQLSQHQAPGRVIPTHSMSIEAPSLPQQRDMRVSEQLQQRHLAQQKSLSDVLQLLPKDFLPILIQSAQLRFMVGGKVDFGQLHAVVEQMLEMHPFLKDKQFVLHMLLLNHNVPLLSSYKSWLYQEKGIADPSLWPLPPDGHHTEQMGDSGMFMVNCEREEMHQGMSTGYPPVSVAMVTNPYTHQLQPDSSMENIQSPFPPYHTPTSMQQARHYSRSIPGGFTVVYDAKGMPHPTRRFRGELPPAYVNNINPASGSAVPGQQGFHTKTAPTFLPHKTKSPKPNKKMSPKSVKNVKKLSNQVGTVVTPVKGTMTKHTPIKGSSNTKKQSQTTTSVPSTSTASAKQQLLKKKQLKMKQNLKAKIVKGKQQKLGKSPVGKRKTSKADWITSQQSGLLRAGTERGAKVQAAHKINLMSEKTDD